MRVVLGSVAAALLAVCALPAAAATLGFGCITNNSATDCGIGQGQLQVDVTDEAPGQVRFTFRNAGPSQSVISEIYFESTALASISSIVNGSGVSFAQGANPPDLPGGNNATPPFSVTPGLLAQAANPAPTNGVGAGEQVAIILNLQSGTTFSDVLTDLGNGNLRTGIHVIAFASGGSESFVNSRLPEPGSALLHLLVLAGVAGLAALRRAHQIG
jgi:hypothetical protein